MTSGTTGSSIDTPATVSATVFGEWAWMMACTSGLAAKSARCIFSSLEARCRSSTTRPSLAASFTT